MLRLHGLRLGEMLIALGHVHTVEPHFISVSRIVKEKNIGCDACVWREYAARHTDYSMQIKFVKELPFYACLCVIVAKEKAVRENDCRPALVFQSVHDDRHKKVGSLAACQIIREISFDTGIFMTAVGWIHKDFVEFIFVCVIKYIFQQGIAVVHVGIFYPMQQHVRNTEKIWKRLLFHSVDRVIYFFVVLCCDYLRLKMLQPAC